MANSVIHTAHARLRRLLKKDEVSAQVLPDVIQEAYALAADQVRDPVESGDLQSWVSEIPEPEVEARTIFTLDGITLPCWLESDFDPADPWLTSPTYYPLYYSLFRRYSRERAATRLLEIGVRTGYAAVVFAKAAAHRCFYFGIDPNIYLANGLDLAASSLRPIRAMRPDFEYAMLEGYSSDPAVQRSASHAGAYDLIHIDGDHTLTGKLVDLDFARRVAAPGGLVLVDDYDHHGSVVRDAVRRALALRWFNEFAYVASHRGLAVLRCSAAGVA